jgi:hypothetical protein
MTPNLHTAIRANGSETEGSVAFAGITCSRGELLRSPVSNTPCVHWRLRIAEQVNGSLRLVHEIASTEDFDLVWSGTESASASAASQVRIRVAAQTASIQATPVLHRPGSPGAILTGRQFGFSGQLSVEEVALRVGEEVTAEGIIETPDGGWSAPFRGVEREIELLAATICLPTRAALGPVLLPWALGTAAALLGGVGAATWAAWHFDLVPRFREAGTAHPDEVGPYRPVRRHFSIPE